MKECPLCGGVMRLVKRERAEHVPGRAQPTTRQIHEWVCSDCDYWEEAESGAG